MEAGAKWGIRHEPQSRPESTSSNRAETAIAAVEVANARGSLILLRTGLSAIAPPPVLPEASLVGALSAQRQRPRPRSAMSGQRRLETSLKRLKCAKSGHSARTQRTGQIDPERPFAVGPMNRRCAPDCGRRREATDVPFPNRRSAARFASVNCRDVISAESHVD